MVLAPLFCHFTFRNNLTLLHSEWPELYGVLAVLNVIGLNTSSLLFTSVDKVPLSTRMVVQGQLVEPAVCFSDLNDLFL